MELFKYFPTGYTSVLWLLALSLLLIVSVIRRRVPRNFPPGPTPLPLIGNLHQLDLRRLDWSLMGLAEKYGSVFSVEIGPLKAVVLTGYDAVKDALVNHADLFTGRPRIPIYDDFSFRNGVIFSDGKLWQDNRKFVISALRGFGMGKKSIEDRITEEASFLVNVFESHKGQPFETAQIMYLAVSNIICSIMFGDRFDYNNEVFVHLTNMMNENTRLIGTAPLHLYNAYPSLGFLIPGRQKIIENQVKMHEIFEGFFKAAKETLSEISIQTFCEALIMRHQQELGSQDIEIKEKDILVTINDLFAAGTETTSTTICWGLVLMINYPEIQRKVQDEIDRVIGAGRFPRTGDQRHMPYTDAVIHEIQRFANIMPMNLPHSTTKDTHFREYFISKGTYVIPLLTSVLYDKTQRENPNEFNPAHFLDADGNFVKTDTQLTVLTVPCSFSGRRVCAGEALAKVELFLFFTTLLQKFHFQAPPGVTDLDTSPRIGLVTNPKPHRVCAVPR
ncbi:cytochrome P450 2K1-like [Rhincodon typus]|uniref:cytochrome P450 2K1-like n=1 Tax=Rhincodon typus TaxID=259920 RepID=UPI00202FF077|nr:cytochrome P450 2K1-like [Rhincodon typus]